MIHKRVELSEVQSAGLREARQRAGFTQGEIAELVNVNQSTVSNWEETDRACSIPRLALRTLLGVYWLRSEGACLADYRDHNLEVYFDHSELKE